MALPKSCTAFQGTTMIASGAPEEVALSVKAAQESGSGELILIFDDETGRQIDFDLRGTDEEVLARLKASDDGAARGEVEEEVEAQRRGPGRPRLGVVAREVTLLPRHWEWLERQPGGASAALRRLVEAARRGEIPSERRRQGKEALYRFMSAMAGDYAGFEEATRALYNDQRDRFEERIAGWPPDVRRYIERLAGRAF